MKHILGISAGFHDAAISVIAENGDIMFAGHSERYSRIKNDPTIHPELLRECCNYYIDEIAFYERPWMHNWQQLRSGQYNWGHGPLARPYANILAIGISLGNANAAGHTILVMLPLVFRLHRSMRRR